MDKVTVTGRRPSPTVPVAPKRPERPTLGVGSMIPTATGQAGRTAGLATVLGFAISAGLSTWYL